MKRGLWNGRCCLRVSVSFICKSRCLIFCFSAMQTLRVYRPRLVIYGSVGMGQGCLGAATLHFLEGFHVQSFELGTLMSDSTRVGFIP